MAPDDGTSGAERVDHDGGRLVMKAPTKIRCVLVLSMAGGLAYGPSTTAQTPSPIVLSPGRSGPAFIKVEAVRELEDGRTLVIDSRERALMIVDWSSAEPKTIGRAGDGPGEYRYPGSLIPLKGDSTLVTDRQNGRWYLLYRDRIVTTLPADRPLVRFAGVNPSADTMGRLLVTHGTHFSGRIGADGGADSYRRSDSAAVMVVHRNNEKTDTVARIRGPFRGTNTVRARVDGMNIAYILTNPLAAGDLALLFPDGWIAIALVSPYRVQWHAPGGTVIRGPPLPHSPQRVDDRVKQQAVDDRWAGPGSRAPKFALTDFPAWPDVVPPFLENALLSLPDGRLAIRRTSLGAERSMRYDIVDRRGSLSGIVRLPPNERIMAFGPKAVYVVAVGPDDLETLRRHPWP
jgi:hypothetical protein